MTTETLEACLEYSNFGFNEVSCRSWVAEVNKACYKNCGNCTLSAPSLREICKFTLQVLGNGQLIEQYCKASEFDFQHYRCPGACYDNPLDCLVAPEFVPTNYEYTQPFNLPAPITFEANASTCMYVCGVYAPCHCRKRRGTLLEDECLGLPVVDGPMHNRTGENYTCEYDPIPCRDHLAEGICRPYRWCEPDMCIINRVKCISPHQCLDDGVCMPIDGHCYFNNREDGYPCNDEVFYTVNDVCISGTCIGTTDYCLKYNVTCEPLSECTTGGVCHPHSGRCTYNMKPDDTLCDDQRMYTVEDRCQKGLCVGQTIDLCHEMGVECQAPNECYNAGICNPQTGQCSEPVPIQEAIACNDGDPTTQNDTCMDGVCLGFPSVMKFKTLGNGDCADRDGLRMDRYSGDVVDEDECERTCLGDAQCFAYGYAFPLCSIYGTVRTTAPTGDRDWSFQRGSQPTAAVIIEEAAKPAPGAREGVCRLRGEEGDVEQPMDDGKIDVKHIFNPYTLSAFFTVLLIMFFIRPIARCVRVCLCGVPKEPSAIVSAAPPLAGTLYPSLTDASDDQLRVTAALPDVTSPSSSASHPNKRPPPLEDAAPSPPATPAPEVSVDSRTQLPGTPADLTVKDLSPERAVLEEAAKAPSQETVR